MSRNGPGSSENGPFEEGPQNPHSSEKNCLTGVLNLAWGLMFTYEDGYPRIRLRGGCLNSTGCRTIQFGRIDLKTWDPILMSLDLKGFLTDLKNFHFG